MEDWRNRDPNQEWAPDPSAFGIESKTATETAAAEDEPEKEKSLLDFVEPQRVTASIRLPTEAGSWTVSLSFWNVGSMVEGYGTVSVKLVIVQKDSEPETITGTGTFSGGPDGVMRFKDEETPVLVHDGQTVSYKTATGQVANPQAFDNWPDAFR